ncbi:hypothetical protein AVEN_255168-1 [Araneus ventricosus]|uniref:Uncharacterized protein n=1 Tax=Araneus ventricosus TaxID=182803 RepID=A0A4Y2B9I0_ARAVE|nr:hypothetical protein AVEN_255168-1 [Araneus ventricosus]
MEVSKVRRVFLEPLGSNSRLVGCRIVLLELSQSVVVDASGVLYHANCTRPIPSQRLHQIEQFPVDKQGLWINDVVSILVHVHPSDTIGNETPQTRQCVSSHQEFNGSVVGPRRGVKLCAVQSVTIHASGLSALRAHIIDGPLNSSHSDTCRCPIIEIRGNMRKCCTSISFKDSRLRSMVQFFQGLFPSAPMAGI